MHDTPVSVDFRQPRGTEGRQRGEQAKALLEFQVGGTVVSVKNCVFVGQFDRNNSSKLVVYLVICSFETAIEGHLVCDKKNCLLCEFKLTLD